MDLKDKIKVMQHFANGGKVEYSYLRLNAWKLTDAPVWNWDSYDYRIAQPKTKQPLTAADFPPGTAIRDQSGIWQLITACTKDNLRAADWITPEKLMKYKFEYSTDQGKTWLPCYKYVQTLQTAKMRL